MILTSFPLSRLITENTEQIPPPYSSTSPLTTGLSCYLIEFLVKLFADFCQIRYYYFRQIRHCFQIRHFWRGPSWHFIEYSQNRWRIFAMLAVRHILQVIIFSSYCWQNFVKFAMFVVVWISGHRCLWAQNLATIEQVVWLFCLLFSNLPHYTNPLNTRKKIEINKLLCPGNLNKTRGLYNSRFPHKRRQKTDVRVRV